MSGKGSDQRPTDHKKFSENYDLIFGKKDDKNSISAKRPLAKARPEDSDSQKSRLENSED
jgi:hypothetical protein